MIYWFTGASTQAVTTGAYRAVEFIKANIKLDGAASASIADSKKSSRLHQVRAKGHAQHFHRGVLRHAGLRLRRTVFLHRLSLLHRHLRLYQAIFMANAAVLDNAKKIVEVELKQKARPSTTLHHRRHSGRSVKDTSSVASILSLNSRRSLACWPLSSPCN